MTKVSVCMATYNGAAFVEKQLMSVLPQLRKQDEVILVDDGSSDATLDRVQAIDDGRIHIYKNFTNVGVVRSFERAIGLASGEIIFLSDQDDIWHQDKVAKMINVFKNRPEVTLVMSDARIIDDLDNEIVRSYFALRGGFKSGIVHNIIKNKYLGCLMAFRSCLLGNILPFPENIPGHDIWIGLMNTIHGNVRFVNESLMDYRRHDRNTSKASSNKRENILKVVLWRWQLIRAVSSREFSRCIRNVTS